MTVLANGRQSKHIQTVINFGLRTSITRNVVSKNLRGEVVSKRFASTG